MAPQKSGPDPVGELIEGGHAHAKWPEPAFVARRGARGAPSRLRRPPVQGARQIIRNGLGHVGPGADLPFETGRFDLVVAYNMLMDVEDVPGVLRELRRVMRPTGTLVVSIVHPIADHGHFAGSEPDANFISSGTYFGRQRFDGADERNSLTMHFGGWSQPIEAYAAAIEGAGLAITSLREPVPARLDAMPHIRRWTRFPLFLWLKARPFVPPGE